MASSADRPSGAQHLKPLSKLAGSLTSLRGGGTTIPPVTATGLAALARTIAGSKTSIDLTVMRLRTGRLRQMPEGLCSLNSDYEITANVVANDESRKSS